jgi:hypothetical protein
MKRAAAIAFALLFAVYAPATKSQSEPPRKDIPTIAKAAKGAVVTIVMANDDKPLSQGTGFLVQPDGVLLTNHHVIETGNIAAVKFPDGTVLPVDGVLAADKTRDVAAIKIHGKDFKTLVLGNSDHIQVGEEVVAIGNPLSLESTVSNGIVSGIRTTEKLGGEFLQTTAPISPGSSGGPLFNMSGEVIGINTMYLEGGENLNFAIPINAVKHMLQVTSSRVQALPNEPVPSQTQHSQTQKHATLSEQKMCSEQAERNFNTSSFSDLKVNDVYTYTSYLQPGTGVCYMEVTGRYTYGNGARGYSNTIFDAFENRDYGMYVDSQGYSRPASCHIYLPGKPGIWCSSREEFDRLVLKYFGTVPD